MGTPFPIPSSPAGPGWVAGAPGDTQVFASTTSQPHQHRGTGQLGSSPRQNLAQLCFKPRGSAVSSWCPMEHPMGAHGSGQVPKAGLCCWVWGCSRAGRKQSWELCEGQGFRSSSVMKSSAGSLRSAWEDWHRGTSRIRQVTVNILAFGGAWGMVRALPGMGTP